MPRVDVAGASIAYEIKGHGNALVLISGLNGLGDFWRAQVDALSPHFRTITFDHRGVGGSTGSPPYSVEQWAGDLVALLDHLGIGLAHLVGHSTGGVIAQVVASDYPDRIASAVLGGMWAQPDDRFRWVFELRRDVLVKLGVEAYARLTAIMTSPPGEEVVSIQPAQTGSIVTAARIEAILAYAGFERLRRIDCPTLVIAAADDILIPAPMSLILADEITGARSAVLPSGGYLFPRSRSLDYHRILMEFLLNLAQQRRVRGVAS